MHETGLRLSLVAGRNKTEIPLHDGELYENKCVGWNFTIEAAFLLSRQCLVTTKKAAVALGMILNNCLDSLFALKKTTFHLESLIFKHGGTEASHRRFATLDKCDGKLGPSIVRISDAKIQ